MVPRESRAESPVRERMTRLPDARFLLKRAVAFAKSTATAAAHAVRTRDVGVLRTPGSAAVGVVALVAGAAARVAYAPPGDRSGAVLAAAAAVLWAFARLAILALTVRDIRRDTPSLIGAWSVGLLVWPLALTPLFSALAWMVSGALTLMALGWLGEGRRTARQAVLAAWGAHGAFGVAVWLATNAWVATLAAS